jgi:hypothetical protein
VDNWEEQLIDNLDNEFEDVLGFAREYVTALPAGTEVISWQIRQACPVQPKNPNVWGSVMRSLARDGYLRRRCTPFGTPVYRMHPSPSWHGREVKVWIKPLREVPQ